MSLPKAGSAYLGNGSKGILCVDQAAEPEVGEMLWAMDILQPEYTFEVRAPQYWSRLSG